MTIFLLLAATGITSVAVITALLGFAGTAITQFIKKVAGTSGKVALFLTIAVSFVLAAITTYFTGELDGINVINSAALIFSVATIAYKTLLADDGVLPVSRGFKG